MQCIECKTVFPDRQELLSHFNMKICLKAKRVENSKDICIKCKKNFPYSYYLSVYNNYCKHISRPVSKL
jgi:hypothetical protein